LTRSERWTKASRMTLIHDLTLPVDPRALLDRLYGGDVLCLRQSAPMRRLVAHTRAMLEAAFAPHQPPQIHQFLDHGQQAERFAQLQREFWQDGEVRAGWAEVFALTGLQPDAIARDKYHLRFQPHQDEGANLPRHRATSTLAFHRDTWGSNLYAQVNWWGPVYEIDAGRTMAVYPELWSRPAPNTTRSFDLAAIIARSRDGGRNAVNADEAIPHVEAGADLGPAVPVVIAPGDLLLFSAAHAHAGVPNHTGLTRISLETRTVLIEDVRAGRGAPNIDGEAPWMAPGWFRRVSDGAKLSDILGVDHLMPVGTRFTAA
jgi:hypothetical protein